MSRILTCLWFLSTLIIAQSIAGQRDELWDQVYRARDNGLPRTAIEVLDQIIPAALADQAYAEATKAICLKIVYEAQIEGNKLDEGITRLQAAVETVPEPMRPCMEVLLGHWYWQYFQANRWRFMHRTTTSQPPGQDITTWDLATILAEIDRHYSRALQAAEFLKATAIGEFDELLQKGTVPDTYRPTLYDFVAFEALKFYMAGEQVALRPMDAYDLSADTPIFDSVEQFLQWDLPLADESASLKGIRLLQEVLRFHKDDPDPTAFIDADLQRLEFGYARAAEPQKEQRYVSALQQFVQRWADHEISATALYYWARAIYYGQDDPATAYQIAMQGKQAFPESYGGKACHNLIQEILGKSFEIQTERIWSRPMPSIRITYKNMDRIHFRAIPFSFDPAACHDLWPWRYPSSSQKEALLTQQPAKAWSCDLPATPDYKPRTLDLLAPSDLKAGPYYILASYDPNFGQVDNQVRYATVWVTDMTMILRSLGPDRFEVMVLDAQTGWPTPGAQVELWQYDWTSGSRTCKVIRQTTDADGIAGFSRQSISSESLVLVRHKGQILASDSTYYSGGWAPPQGISERTILFTDRAIYRPGQIIRYKGICVRADYNKQGYQTLANIKVVVSLLDANGQVVDSQQLYTNEYGSFSGSFTAPEDRLLGSMSIIVSSGPSGSVSFFVEQYKRPTFSVQLDPPNQAFRLGEDVAIHGRAVAYTGATIGNATVRWIVQRHTSVPIWCWWHRPEPVGQLIATGSTITGADGSLSIVFTARPDLSVPAEDEPIFDFTINAEVTDPTGETRAKQITIRIGYTALKASIDCDQWLTTDLPVRLSISTQTLDGQPQPAQGTISIYSLQQPEKVVRPDLSQASGEQWQASLDTWPIKEQVYKGTFTTDQSGSTDITVSLGPGPYRAILYTQDRFGTPITALCTFQVLDPTATRFGIRVPNYLSAPTWSLQPGQTFICLWGTGYETGRAFVEIECNGLILKRMWTDPNRTQQMIEQQVTERMWGGFTLKVTYVRENRAYITQRIVDVPWLDKQLSFRWEHFKSMLEPGQRETWSLVITGPKAEAAVAEVLVGMYDASLEQFVKHRWPSLFELFRQEYGIGSSQFENKTVLFLPGLGDWIYDHKDAQLLYRQLQSEFLYTWWRGIIDSLGVQYTFESGSKGATTEVSKVLGTTATSLDLAQFSIRKDLDETAFFYPHLISGADGVVRIDFAVPEALTEWRFMAFAHDRLLRNGFISATAVTAKDLMVQPNPPRFVREADQIEFTVKVSNQSSVRQTGQVYLTFNDAWTDTPMDTALGNTLPVQTFDIPSRQSQTFCWRITIPDGCGTLIYKAIAISQTLGDGQQGYLPILSRRTLVTESLTLPVRGPQTKDLEFTSLLQSGQSDTLRHQSLTVQMASQPAWYAVMALPYLMEDVSDCTDRIFTRLYANTLARYIANSDPRIRQIFVLWQGTNALDSPLEKDQDLKTILLQETPWIRQAQGESQARRNIEILFDHNRLDDEINRAVGKLAQLQGPDGLWPWWSGGSPSRYITLYIVTGIARLRHLGAGQIGFELALKAIDSLDAWIDQSYQDILAEGTDDLNHLDPIISLYLYGRSFFLVDKPITDAHKPALDFWLLQARRYWTRLCRQSQGHLALALKRFGDLQTARQIMASIRQFSITSQELGMFWRDTEGSWWWYKAPIETQALMIEAFDEVENDQQAVEDCKVWLLKQKHTQAWPTTKATADAVYAILLRGTNLLESTALGDIALGGVWIQPDQVEAGTGFYEKRFTADQVQPQMGHVTIRKTDQGVSWGSVHWQYLEDLSKITAYTGTPLSLTKDLYVKRITSKGPLLVTVDGPVSVGDELVVRIIVRVDRDMEFVHLKDQRPSGCEPISVLSGYRCQDGLWYYQDTQDAATNFFFEYLPKGTYVLEYSTKVQHKGRYQTGIATIQCMYAPEFNSHSAGFLLEVN